MISLFIAAAVYVAGMLTVVGLLLFAIWLDGRDE